jgi:hypothetical protein
MKRKIIAMFLVMLMCATMFAGVTTVSAVDEQEVTAEMREIFEKPGCYVIEEDDAKSRSSGDCFPSIYNIGWTLGNNWRVKYEITSNNDDPFTATFEDRITTDDDVDEYNEDVIYHNQEQIEVGSNRYTSDWFSLEYTGWWDFNVYMDDDDEIPSIYDVDDTNNKDTECKYCLWI